MMGKVEQTKYVLQQFLLISRVKLTVFTVKVWHESEDLLQSTLSPRQSGASSVEAKKKSEKSWEHDAQPDQTVL